MRSVLPIGTATAVIAIVMNLAPPPAAAASGAALFTPQQVAAEVWTDEVAALGQDRAERLAYSRLMADDDGYPQETRTESLAALTRSQAELNETFPVSRFGRFADYFPSPDFGVHVALLPTGKMLLFSFERIQTNPTRETAPTFTVGEANAGRAYLWDPAKGMGRRAFKAVPPPVVEMPDGLDESRPAPFFCAGHAYLPNGMLAVFGGNLGEPAGGAARGAPLALIFDPWQERWYRQQDLVTPRWYPSAVTAADGRQVIMSGIVAGSSEQGADAITPIVERFPAPAHPVPVEPAERPRGWSTERLPMDAPFATTYPHLFSLRDGKVYAFGQGPTEQWVFDLEAGTREVLPPRPDTVVRNWGSAVALPGGQEGPDSVLVMGGDRNDPNTYQFSDGQWSIEQPRAFGRNQDDTLLMPDGSLFTVNGAFGTRDYGNGEFNPNADLKYRQTELRDADGNWRLGPAQRLPRGYHSNAVLLPDGRVMVTGDELQQLANDPDISDDMNGTIEIYEPWYLHQGPRPRLDRVSRDELDYGDRFRVTTTTPQRVSRAVLIAPTTSTHSMNSSQRHVELAIERRAGRQLTLTAPPHGGAAPPGYYMLFLLDDRGVPSTAQWVKLNPPATTGEVSPTGDASTGEASTGEAAAGTAAEGGLTDAALTVAALPATGFTSTTGIIDPGAAHGCGSHPPAGGHGCEGGCCH